MAKKLTSAMVKQFYAYMTKKYGAKIIDKNNAAEMEIVGWALDLMGIQDKEDFLNNYSTTVGNRIYLSFEPGSNEIPLINQVETLVHELKHTQQMDRDPLFVVKYLTDKSYRAHKEAAAYCTNLEMHYWYCGQVYNTDKLAMVLTAYALSGEYIRVVQKHLRIFGKVAKLGGVENSVSKVAIKYLNKQIARRKVKIIKPKIDGRRRRDN